MSIENTKDYGFNVPKKFIGTIQLKDTYFR